MRRLYQALLTDARFHQQLLDFDRDLAAIARDAGCGSCSGRLHSAPFARKPRGVPPGVSEDYRQRFSFCCSEDGCRKRATPASLRFLGRKEWLATVVTLATAMQQGSTAQRERRLLVAFGIDRRTLGRWRKWWLETFSGQFRPRVLASLMPPLDLLGVPRTLLDRFAGELPQKLVHLLQFLAPLSGGGAAAMHAV